MSSIPKAPEPSERRVCLCTLAIHAPYRERANRLIADAPDRHWVVLTDQPEDFAGAQVTACRHVPTGPMAIDFLDRHPATGNNRGGAAYHDKRFVFERALQSFDTAIFVDADSRFDEVPDLSRMPAGLSVAPLVLRSIAQHLAQCGTWREPVFRDLARHLVGDEAVLESAPWCHESLMAITRDGRESAFIDAWGRCADYLQGRGVHSGEGGAIGLAAHIAGWHVDFEAVLPLWRATRHEGGGPKRE